MRPRAVDVVVGLVHALVGAVTGVLALVVHRQAVVVDDAPVLGTVVAPWGLALVLVVLHLGTRAAALTGGVRAGAWCFAAGVAATVLAATFPSSTGDVLLAEDVRGYGVLVGGAAAVGLALVRLTSRPNVDT